MTKLLDGTYRQRVALPNPNGTVIRDKVLKRLGEPFTAAHNDRFVANVCFAI